MNSLVKNSFYKLLLNIFNIGIPLIIGPYALRVLQEDKMGTVFYSETIYSYFFIFACFGLYQYGIRELSKKRDDRNKLSELFSSLFIISIGTSITTAIVYYSYINERYTGEPQYILLFIYGMNLVCNLFYVEWAVEALEEYRFITIKTIIVKSIYLILLVSLVKNPDDAPIYVFLYIASIILNNLVSFVYISRKIGFSFKNITIRRHLIPLVMVVIMANVNTLFTTLDRLMLGEFRPEAEVAMYAAPQTISGTLNGLLLSFTAVFVPRLSHILNSDEDSRKSYISLLKQCFENVMFLVIPISIGLFVVADKAMILYGGERYTSSIVTLKIFSIYLITLVIEYVYTNLVMYLNRKDRILTGFILISGLTNLGLNFLMVKLDMFNYNTAILTTLVANTTLISLQGIYAYKKLGISLFTTKIFPCILVCLSFFVVKFLVDSIFSGLVISTILTCGVCALIYMVFLKVTNNSLYNLGMGILNKIIKK